MSRKIPSVDYLICSPKMKHPRVGVATTGEAHTRNYVFIFIHLVFGYLCACRMLQMLCFSCLGSYAFSPAAAIKHLLLFSLCDRVRIALSTHSLLITATRTTSLFATENTSGLVFFSSLAKFGHRG